MAYDLEALGMLLSRSGKSTGSFDKYKALLDTPEGKKVLQNLSGEGGDALKKAAGEAAKGDADAAKKLIMNLLSTKEGAALAKQIMELSKQ